MPPVCVTHESKLTSAEAAVALINDGDCITVSGSVTAMLPTTLLGALEVRFLAEEHPRDLTWFEPFPTGEPGIEPLAHEGLIKRVIGGWYTPHPRMRDMINGNQIEAYLFPLGTLSFWCEAMAAGRDMYLTKVGLETYMDPRHGGGRLNDITKDPIPELIDVRGEQFLAFPRLEINVALIRGTTVDEEGNLSIEDEQVTMNVLNQALAAKRFGGKVIVQAQRLVGRGTIPPRLVAIPGLLVDAIVLEPQLPGDGVATPLSSIKPADRVARPPSRVIASPEKEAWNTWLREGRIDDALAPEHRELTPDIIIGRRAALEIGPGDVVNVGAGLPLRELPPVAIEEEIDQDVELSVESGALGGILNGVGFRANVTSYLDTPGIFSLYSSGLIRTAFFSMLEFDAEGSINLLRYGDTWVGPGGSMDIGASVGRLVFCGTLRAGGLQVASGDGALRIVQEGSVPRAVQAVQGVCFRGPKLLREGKEVLYVTERAVFALTPEGPELIEVAPGIDCERDVLAQMCFQPRIARHVGVVDPRVYTNGPMGIRTTWLARSTAAAVPAR